MSTASVQQQDEVVVPEAADSRPAADRFMRKLLRVSEVQRTARVEREAHRGFQISLVISGIRCLVTYLLIPIAFPLIGLSGMFAAPVGILLGLVAAYSGIVSLRRFWQSDHRMRWTYTAFIAVVFMVLIIAFTVDISRIVSML